MCIRGHQLKISVAVLAIAGLQQAAQATLVLEASGPAVFTASPSGKMSADYNVVYNTSDSLYTYLYSFTPIAGNPIENFSVAASYVSSVLTTAVTINGTPYTITGAITSDGTFEASGGLVSWSFDPATSAGQVVGFSSYIGPGAGTGSLMNDDTGPWGTQPPAPPSTVPEVSTLVSGALMLLPFGMGVVRSVRKQRTA